MFPCYANKTQSLSAGTDNGLFECMQICSFLAFQTKGWTAGVRSSGSSPGNKKPQALSAQIIDVNLQATLLCNKHFRKIFRSPLKKSFVCLENVNKG